jgi:uncharacterized membrane protein
MEAVFKTIAGYADLGCELAAVVVLAIGAVEALVSLALTVPRWSDIPPKKLVWARFASWLVLGLEFTLAGDIIRTAIAPSWNDIGQLGAIAAIRTALNWFLERDIEVFQAGQQGPPPPSKPATA